MQHALNSHVDQANAKSEQSHLPSQGFMASAHRLHMLQHRLSLY
jgi:hypothetical protein